MTVFAETRDFSDVLIAIFALYQVTLTRTPVQCFSVKGQ